MNRTLATSLVIAGLACFAGCGDDGSDGDHASAETGPPVTSADTTSDAEAKASSGASVEQGGGERSKGEDESSQGSKAQDPTSSGRKLAAVHGDGSIESFGERAEAGARNELLDVARDYYAAMGGGDWARGCALMTSTLRTAFETKDEDGSSKSCAETIAAEAARRPDMARGGWPGDTRFYDVRTEDHFAFVLFRSSSIRIGFLTLHDVDGQWRVNAFFGSPVNPAVP